MQYWTGLAVTFELYLILALSLNLLVGYAGVVSLCHAAFYGVGAYGSALLMLKLGWGFPAALAGAAALTMVLGAVVALPALRLKGDYFIIATVGLQAIVYRALYNLEGLTRGPLGLSGIPPLRVGSWTAEQGSGALLVAATVCTLLVMAVLARLASSPFGRILRALRDDEAAVEALGRRVASFKVKAFLVGSACAAVAGALLAVRLGALEPDQFAISESVLILTALVLGGVGNLWGPCVGAALVVGVPQVVQWLWRGSGAGEIRQILFGLLLVVLLRVRPRGVAGVDPSG